jgi:UV DNA damage endonuclease
LVKLIHWNEKYGIKFLRISSQMFPFASHAKYGYDLDFARETLGEAGRVAMEFGHRLTMHPGQFTQLGSPRKEVIEASVKDLEYHSQLLRGLALSGQADKDAVMILHMGGMFGDRKATLERFKKNYEELLSEDVKARLVLENDDVVSFPSRLEYQELRHGCRYGQSITSCRSARSLIFRWCWITTITTLSMIHRCGRER